MVHNVVQRKFLKHKTQIKYLIFKHLSHFIIFSLNIEDLFIARKRVPCSTAINMTFDIWHLKRVEFILILWLVVNDT